MAAVVSPATSTMVTASPGAPSSLQSRASSLTPAGATASNAVVKAWQAKGGKVLATSKAVPIKHVIASPNLPPEQAELVREYLLGLDTTDEGKKRLEPTKWKGFAPYDNAAMMALGAWLGL